MSIRLQRDYDRLAGAMMDRAGLDPWRLEQLPTGRPRLEEPDRTELA